MQIKFVNRKAGAGEEELRKKIRIEGPIEDSNSITLSLVILRSMNMLITTAYGVQTQNSM